jgi:alanine racemase
MALLYFDYDIATIQSRMLLLFPVEMRLKVKPESIIVVLSMIVTVLIFSLWKSHWFPRKSKAIPKKDGYSFGYISKRLVQWRIIFQSFAIDYFHNISRVIGIGETPNSKINFNCITFNNTAEFISNFDKLSFANETILIKGAVFQFEEIVYLLEEKTHETVLEINLNGISYNLNF